MVNGQVSQLTPAELSRLRTTGSTGLRPESILSSAQAEIFAGAPIFKGGGVAATGFVSPSFSGGAVGGGVSKPTVGVGFFSEFATQSQVNEFLRKQAVLDAAATQRRADIARAAAEPARRDLTVVLPPARRPSREPSVSFAPPSGPPAPVFERPAPSRFQPRFGVAGEEEGLEPLPEFRPAQPEPFEFTPRGFARFTERRLAPVIPTTPRAAVTTFLVETLVKPPSVKLALRPGIAAAEASLAPGAFLFRGGAEALVSEAERIKGRTFQLDIPVTRPVGKIISPLLGAPPGVVLGKVPIRREEIGVAAEFAGELATLEFFAAISPKALRQGREALSIGERGGIGVAPKKKLPKRVQDVELGKFLKPVKLKPKFVRPFEPTVKEFRAGIERAPKLGRFLDPARALEFEETQLLKALRARPVALRKPPKVPKTKPTFVRPFEPTVKEFRLAIERAPKLGKVVTVARPLEFEEKVLAKVLPKISKRPFFKDVPTTAGLFKQKPLSLQAFAKQVEKIAKPVRLKPIIPLRLAVTETQQLIPGAASALGLKAGKKAERAARAVFADIELVSTPVVSVQADRFRPSVFVPIVSRERFKAEEKLGIRVTPVITPRIGIVSRVAVIPKVSGITAIKEIDVTKIKVADAIKIRVPTVERLRFREAERFRLPVLPRLRFPDITRIERRRITEERVPREPRRVPRLPLLQLPRLPRPRKPTRLERQFGFALEVRRGGRFVSAFPGKLFTEATAKGLAQQLVGGTPLASFRIKRFLGKPIALKGLPTFRPEQFRKPIRAGIPQLASATFIEKTKFRIDQPEEFRGITLKGLATLEAFPEKRKRKKKKGKAKKKGKKRKAKRKTKRRKK